jgi:hypothetical protein
MDSNPYLSNILHHGVPLWFRNKYYDPNTVPLGFRRIIGEQNSIGWHHLFQGRFSKEWRRQQDIHLATKAEADPKKGGSVVQIGSHALP